MQYIIICIKWGTEYIYLCLLEFTKNTLERIKKEMVTKQRNRVARGQEKAGNFSLRAFKFGTVRASYLFNK